MKTLLLLLLASSCATLTGQNIQTEYCGAAGSLSVYRLQYSLIDCREAMEITEAAQKLLQDRVGEIRLAWRVEYMWGAISVEDPLARTTSANRLIQVQSGAPESIFHELLHVYLYETGAHGDDHRQMCRNSTWRQAENEFGVRPHCSF